MRLRLFTSIDEIRAAAPAWDRLWQRSDVSLPTARAELAAEWLECFAPRATVRVLAVEQDGELVGLLPLAGWRYRGLLPVGGLTGNVWAFNGELLLDPAADQPAVLDRLAEAMVDLPWPLVWLEMVPAESSRWQGLVEALERHGLQTEIHPRYRIGQVRIEGDFAQYEAGRSRSLRQQVRKCQRRLEDDGAVRLALYWQLSPGEVEGRLRQAFQIEERSWKDEFGGTALGTPGMFDFYLRQARQLAEWGCLRLAMLEHRGEPFAFELGWTAKGVYHSCKVGYLSTHRRYGPGHLLRRELIRTLFDQPGHVLVDFQGPLTEALDQWSTQTYQIARLIIGSRRIAGRAAMTGYRVLAPLVRGMRGGGDG